MSLVELVITPLSNQIDSEKLRRVMEVKRFLDEVEYDSNAIDYDGNREISFVKNRTPDEVVRDKRATCMSGVFYSARELRKYFGEKMISFEPIIQKRDTKGRFCEVSGGIGHGMYLFKINGFYGAISKSREELLSFVPPEYKDIAFLVLSPQILRGYQRLTKSRDEIFLGINFRVADIRKRFPNYDIDPNNKSRGEMVLLRVIRFSNIRKKIPGMETYLRKILESS